MIKKNILQLAQLVVNTGGIAALIEVITTTQSARLPAIMSLGYIAGHSDQLAMAIIGSKGVTQLSTLLNDDNDDHALSITVWTLGQIGKHSYEHAKAIAIENIFPKILYVCKFNLYLIAFIILIYFSFVDVFKNKKLRGFKKQIEINFEEYTTKMYSFRGIGATFTHCST